MFGLMAGKRRFGRLCARQGGGGGLGKTTATKAAGFRSLRFEWMEERAC